MIPIIPSTPYGDIAPHWQPYLDALDAWIDTRGPSGPRRPYLYQPAGDVDAVQARVDVYDGLRESIVEAATSSLTGDLPDHAVDSRPHEMRSWLARAVGCADAWLLTGDEMYAARACEIAECGMSWPDWIAIEHEPLTIDLRSAAAVRSIALIRDRIDGWMDDAQRAEIVNYLAREVVRYVGISDAHSEWWTYSTHNWRTVVCGGYGTAALAIMDHFPEDLLRAALWHTLIGSFVVLDSGDPDGGWFEGVSYWKYGIGEAVELIDALHWASDGAVDLFTHPYLAKTGDFAIYMTWPDGRVYDWADCGERVNATHLMARLAKAAQRSDWQEYVRRFPAQPTFDTLFWEDRELEPSPYDELPRVKHFRGTEVAVLRAGWADDDLIVGVKAGETTANHSHLDVGSFAVEAFGHTLIGDGGHWDYAFGKYFFDNSGPRWDYPGLDTALHSTILVDGLGQSYGPEYRGVVAASGDHDDWAYCTIDASAAYPQLDKFVRYVLLIRPDTVVIVDDLGSTGDRVRFSWRAILSHTVERPEWPIWVTGNPDGGPSLTMRWLLPFGDDGIIADVTEHAATYRSRAGMSVPSARSLTVSPMIRSREVQLAVGMRVNGEGVRLDPAVSLEEAYRSVRISAKRPGSGARRWSITWGQPGVQAFAG